MNHFKIYFVILSFAFLIASTSLASDHKNSQFRYLSPLSTNLKQQQDIEDSKEPEPMIHEDDDMVPDNKRIPGKNLKDNLEFVIEFSKSAADKVRESELKMKEVEREVMKRKLEGERELKKVMDRIDREHRKYIVEMQREQKKHREEMEKAYRKRLKEMEED
jgi:chromatin assembly factor 1 subunit A